MLNNKFHAEYQFLFPNEEEEENKQNETKQNKNHHGHYLSEPPPPGLFCLNINFSSINMITVILCRAILTVFVIKVSGIIIEQNNFIASLSSQSDQ